MSRGAHQNACLDLLSSIQTTCSHQIPIPQSQNLTEGTGVLLSPTLLSTS